MRLITSHFCLTPPAPLKVDVICVSPLTKIPVFLELGREFEITTTSNLFTSNANFPVWHHYLECQCRVINVKNFHEMLRYLFQILAMSLLYMDMLYFLFENTLLLLLLLRKLWGEPWGVSAQDAMLCQNGHMSHEKQWNDLHILCGIWNQYFIIYPQPHIHNSVDWAWSWVGA